MAGAERVCVFCGARADSKEHVIRRKLKDYVPDRPRSWTHQEFRADAGLVKSLKVEGDPFERTVRRVCATCNNGWMNALEVRAEPDLAAMIQGNPVRLTMSRARTIALWAAKTALVRGLVDVEAPAATAHHFTCIRDGRIARGTSISIGLVEGIGSFDRHNYGILIGKNQAPGVAEHCYAEQTTIVVGRFVTNVVITSGAAPQRQLVDRVTDAMHEVFPLCRVVPAKRGTIAWPPAPMVGSDLLVMSGFVLDRLAYESGR